MQLAMTILMVCAFAAYAVWAMKRRGAMAEEGTLGMRDLLQQTGFRVTGLHPAAPVEEHVARAMVASAQMGGADGQEWVRDCGGIPVRHVFGMKVEGTTRFMWCRWASPFARPPRFGLQIIDKSVVSAGALVTDFLESKTYGWKQRFPHRVPSGDAALDARFLFFATHPHAVAHAASAQGVKDMLLGCAHVDLVIADDGVVLTDPFRKNLEAGMGGGLGAMKMGYDMRAIAGTLVPVHDRISWLVATLARAAA